MVIVTSTNKKGPPRWSDLDEPGRRTTPKETRQMPTLTQSRPSVKSSRTRPFSCKLLSATVEISGAVYQVEPIDPGQDGTAAYRLAGAKGQVYDVIRTLYGLVECDCPDYEARHRGLDCGCCKHGRALVELGMIEAPKPVPFKPTPEPEPTDEPTVAELTDAWEPTPCCEPDQAVQCAACEAIVTEPAETTADHGDAWEGPLSVWTWSLYNSV
jgi:hypothetical protein